MNPQTPMRFLLAAALLADAIGGFLLYSNGFATPNGEQPVLPAAGLALLVAGVALAVVTRPDKWALALARGIALVMVVGLAGVGLLFLMAANFESGISSKEQSVITGLLLLGLAVQVTIFVTAGSVDGRKPIEVMGSAINGAFAFWAIGVVLLLVLSFFEEFL